MVSVLDTESARCLSTFEKDIFMLLMLLFPIIALSMNLQKNERQVDNAVKKYEVVMYRGFPPESSPAEDREKLEPETPLLVALVGPDGKFHAVNEWAMFEGTLSNEKNDTVQVQIKESHWNSTSGFEISALVKANEPILPKAFGFSSIIFSYYFRVRSPADEVVNAQGLTCEIAAPPAVS
jgi:hypothetical protein